MPSALSFFKTNIAFQTFQILFLTDAGPTLCCQCGSSTSVVFWSSLLPAVDGVISFKATCPQVESSSSSFEPAGNVSSSSALRLMSEKWTDRFPEAVWRYVEGVYATGRRPFFFFFLRMYLWWNICHYHLVFFLPYRSFQLYISLSESLPQPWYIPFWLTGLKAPTNYLIIIIYPLTARVVWALQMISQPVSFIFLCSPLPSRTLRTSGLSIS